MSHYDYVESQRLASMNFSFATLIMGALRKADDINFRKLEQEFPEITAELKARYNARGGLLEGE